MIDCYDDNRLANIKQVEHVLGEIDATDIPMLTVYNKIDLLDEAPENRIDRDENGKPERVWVSAYGRG